MKLLINALLITIVYIVVATSLIYGGFILKRNINYSLSYEQMVKETINEAVKKECLK